MIHLNGQKLTLQQIADVAYGREQVAFAEDARTRAEKARQVVEQIIAAGRTVYGVNTGFGKLSDVSIQSSELRELQLNLVRSHSCGLGAPLSEAEARAMLLLRANVLAAGFSGARPLVIDTLIAMLERGVTPVIPEKGSVGASGDLAPLAHLASTVIGEGEAFFQGERMPSALALQRAQITPLELEVKEGLALLNGTQAMGAVGALALHRADRLIRLADVSGAMTLEALRGTPVAFDERIHVARPHPAQIEVASHLRQLLTDSEIRKSHLNNDPRVQDAYSLRCMPQVHGAIRSALRHARETVEIESGSATDNPLVFADTGEVLSGGNFHGAPVALVLDYAAIALTDLMSITERRIDRLVNPDSNEGLPPFLTTQPGISSGFMMLQVTAVALLNEAKVLSHPASVDNVPTDGGKEDHVSMGMTAAVKMRSIVDITEMATAIELLTAAQALEFRLPLNPGQGVKKAYNIVRSSVPPTESDRSMSIDIEKIVDLIRRDEFQDLLN
ncbi:MAG TPA: histidine ammonia-lyase [Pyrinomonadaceae bacterium]|jgi:histidine ammonia-lyase|nr:histidine ammonia-lyase [Pyrinomonadaceae bacterium]